MCWGLVGARKRGWDGAGVGPGSEERQEAGSSTTSRPEPGRAAHSGAEKGPGEPGKDGETSTTAGVPGDIYPGCQVLLPAAGISKKMRLALKNGDMEG